MMKISILNQKKYRLLVNRGQTAIIVILITAALAVIGISLASRVTKESSLVTQTKESSVVLSAAETGAEQAISQVVESLDAGQVFSEPQSSETSITTNDGVTVNVAYQIVPLDHIDTRVPSGKEVLVDLRDPTTGEPVYNGSLEINWAKEDICDNRASLIVTRYYLDASGQIHSDYQAVGPNCVNRGDKFIQVAPQPSGDYKHIFTINNLQNDGSGHGDLFLTIKPVYHDTDLKVVGDATLPVKPQYIIKSRGINQNNDTPETRAIRIDYTLPLPPIAMDYAVYSGDTLAK